MNAGIRAVFPWSLPRCIQGCLLTVRRRHLQCYPVSYIQNKPDIKLREKQLHETRHDLHVDDFPLWRNKKSNYHKQFHPVFHFIIIVMYLYCSLNSTNAGNECEEARTNVALQSWKKWFSAQINLNTYWIKIKHVWNFAHFITATRNVQLFFTFTEKSAN